MRSPHAAAVLALAALCCTPLAADTLGACKPDAAPPNATIGCLDNGRFQIEATFIDTSKEGQPVTRNAHVVPLVADGVYLWLFTADNPEVFVKVLDGCALSATYWIFAAGLTNVDTTITVTDTLAHVTRTYHRTEGPPFEPLQDTAALSTCP